VPSETKHIRTAASAERVAPNDEATATKPARSWWPWFVIGYVAVVLFVDAFATIPARLPSPFAKETRLADSIVNAVNAVAPFPLSSLQWQPKHVADALAHTPLPAWSYGWMRAPVLRQFDVFKFVFWFLIPLALCGRRVDLKAFTTARWRPLDWKLFYACAVIGFLVVCAVPFIPGVRDYYVGNVSDIPFGDRLFGTIQRLFWVASWLIGWEFMHRYFLLQAVTPRWPRYGWLLAPFFEWAYHLQKHWLEALGMLLFSLALTYYVVRRRNVSLPFFAHLLIEIALPLTVVFTALNPLLWFFTPR